jgi:hypothetical protein
MSTTTTKKSLSGPRRRLVELFQEINFGRVLNLTVRDREPVLDPAPRIVRERKFGGENGPRPERASGDFPLKAQVLELCAALDELGDAVIDLIEVKNGLPFKMEVADPLR